MYGNSIISNSLSLSKIITGISKTLNIANQVIPIYKQAKPLISNFGSTMKLLKTFQNSSNNKTKKETIKTANIIEEPQQEKNTIVNQPKFFI